MITGIWISPDGEQFAAQFDHEAIYAMDAEGSLELIEVDGVPDDWQTVHDMPEVAHCGICGQQLTHEPGHANTDCGGDCRECVGEVERRMR